MINLRKLFLDATGINEGPIPSSLYELSDLENLDFNIIGLTGSIPTEID